jgi:heme-degrading monooxygenase HmoA
MFARVSTLRGRPERLDEAARVMQEEAVPFARQQPGFKAAYWLADRSTGTVLAVSLWESEEAMRASEAAVEPRRRQSAERLGATIESVEGYEVIAHG